MAFIIIAEIYLVIVWEKDINFIKNEMIASLNKMFDDPGNNSSFHYIEASVRHILLSMNNVFNQRVLLFNMNPFCPLSPLTVLYLP